MINIDINAEDIKLDSQPKFSIHTDRTKRKNLFSPPFCFAMYANSRGGKSYLMKSILMDPRYEIIGNYILPENVYICSPTAEDDDTYEDLLDYLESSGKFDKQRQICSDVNKIETFVKGIISENKKLKSQGVFKYPLFICDDLYSQIPLDNKSVFANIATQGRHHLASMFIMTQSHKGLGNAIRRNATHTAVWEFDNGTEIQSIVDEMRGTMMPKDFKQLYLHAVRSKPNGFLFHCRLMPPQLKFSTNLEEIIEL